MTSNSSRSIFTQNHANLEALKILIVTWNVGAKVEQKSEINRLLFADGVVDTTDYPDIVAVGLQEVVELSASNVVGSAIAGQSKDRANKWQEMIMETFEAQNLKFDVISSINMVGLFLVVFAAHTRRSSISKIQASSYARGVGGVLGNKGAVYVRMDILDTSVCFVNAHFAAHREQVLKRNEDFHAILSHKCFPDYLSTNVEQLFSTVTKSALVVQLEQNVSDLKRRATSMAIARAKTQLVMEQQQQQSLPGYHRHRRASVQSLSRFQAPAVTSPMPPAALSPPNPSGAGSNSSSSGSVADSSSVATTAVTAKHEVVALLPRHCADDHDVILWLGDLNYRIVGGIDTSVVYDMIESKRSIYLAPYDQLNQERDKGNAFAHFHEGLLTFEPTYKYIPGQDVYDNRKEKKLRCPAWCDRVLWRIGRNSSTSTKDGFPQDDVSGEAQRGDSDGEGEDSSSGQFASEKTVPELVISPSALEVEANLDCELSRMQRTALMESCAGLKSPDGSVSSMAWSPTSEKTPAKLASDLADAVVSMSGMKEEAGGLSVSAPGGSGFGCQESVELMAYDRCANCISDHKPVRAVLNLKVKRVDWAAFEAARISGYTQQCTVTAPYITKSCHFSNRFSRPAITLEPRTLRIFNIISKQRASQTPAGSSNVQPINSVFFQLTNNLCDTPVGYTVLPSSIPPWLVLSSAEGRIAPQSSHRILASTSQREIDISVAQIRDRNVAYASLPSLSKILLGSSGGNNYTAHSAELYAILEIELIAVADNGMLSSASSASVFVDPSTHIETVLLPIMCSAEHEADLVSLPPTAIRVPALLPPASVTAVNTSMMTATDIRVLI